MAVEWFLRLLGATTLAVGGWKLGTYVGDNWGPSGFIPWGLALTIVGGLLGLAAAPYTTVSIPRKLAQRLQEIPALTLLVGIAGLILGLTVAALISLPFSRLPGWPGVTVPIVLSLILGYLGTVILLTRERELSQLPFSERRTSRTAPSPRDGHILLDTSAIIDGRIADISHTGFLHGTLVIPRFVLDELRHIADSSDSLRRNRGRRGLEMLNKLRKEADIPVQVMDVDGKDGTEVDGKLVKLAKSLHASIVTTDFNLNRVAEIQGVRVLNINELANSLKPVVLPGEEMMVRVIQEGKEAGQGVGFLDDGTMIVVEGGRRYINMHLDVLVTRILQTAAGRIIFAQPKGS